MKQKSLENNWSKIIYITLPDFLFNRSPKANKEENLANMSKLNKKKQEHNTLLTLHNLSQKNKKTNTCKLKHVVNQVLNNT